MPLHRRLPKRGFISHVRSEEVRLADLSKVEGDSVDLAKLVAAGVVSIHATQAKIVLAGEIKRKVSVTGLRVTKGAKAAIEAAGGSVAEFVVPERGRLKKKEKKA